MIAAGTQAEPWRVLAVRSWRGVGDPAHDHGRRDARDARHRWNQRGRSAHSRGRRRDRRSRRRPSAPATQSRRRRGRAGTRLDAHRGGHLPARERGAGAASFGIGVSGCRTGIADHAPTPLRPPGSAPAWRCTAPTCTRSWHPTATPCSPGWTHAPKPCAAQMGTEHLPRHLPPTSRCPLTMRPCGVDASDTGLRTAGCELPSYRTCATTKTAAIARAP